MGRLEKDKENVKGQIKSVYLSADGQMACTGTAAGIVVYTRNGDELYRYPPGNIPVPVVQVIASPDFKHIFVATLDGELRHIEFDGKDRDFTLKKVTDMHSSAPAELQVPIASLSFNPHMGLLAAGYSNNCYAVWKTNGKLLWKGKSGANERPNVSGWFVSLDMQNEKLYIGSSLSGRGYLDALAVSTGNFLGPHQTIGPGVTITAMTSLHNNRGVVTAQSSRDDFLYLDVGTVVGLSTDLSTELWPPLQYEDMAITALAADDKQPLLAIAVGFDGQVDLLNSATGEYLAPRGQLKLHTRVNELAIFDGRFIAAACSEGLFWLQFYPG